MCESGSWMDFCSFYSLKNRSIHLSHVFWLLSESILGEKITRPGHDPLRVLHFSSFTSPKWFVSKEKLLQPKGFALGLAGHFSSIIKQVSFSFLRILQNPKAPVLLAMPLSLSIMGSLPKSTADQATESFTVMAAMTATFGGPLDPSSPQKWWKKTKIDGKWWKNLKFDGKWWGKTPLDPLFTWPKPPKSSQKSQRTPARGSSRTLCCQRKEVEKCIQGVKIQQDPKISEENPKIFKEHPSFVN